MRLLQKYPPIYPPRYSVSLLGVPLVTEYLEARTLADATNTNSLISVIRQTSDALLTEDEKGKQDIWRTYVHALCQAANKNMGDRSVIKHLNTAPGWKPVQKAKPQDILAAAVYLGQFSRVKDLLDSVSDAALWSDYFGGSIQLAAGEGHEQILIMLLEHGTNLSGGRSSKDNIPLYVSDKQVLGTALEMASLAGHNQIVRLLQESEYIDRSGYHYEWALKHAAHEGHLSTVQILLDQWTSDRMIIYEHILVNASLGGHIQIVQMMLDLGVKVNPESIAKPIHHAARWGRHEVIELLLTRGAKQAGGFFGTPLCEATRRGFIQATQVLIDHGAKIDDWWPSPLIEAARYGQEHIVQLLIDRGVNLNFKKCGSMALCRATAEGHESVVRVLVKAGLDVDERQRRPIGQSIDSRRYKRTGSYGEVFGEARSIRSGAFQEQLRPGPCDQDLSR